VNGMFLCWSFGKFVKEIYSSSQPLDYYILLNFSNFAQSIFKKMIF